MAYSNLTWLQLKTALLDRLGDSTYWTDDTAILSEAHVYLQEAMRVWGALTERWKERVSFTLTQDQHWYDLSTEVSLLANSVTDRLLLGEIEFHLIEPLSLTSYTGSDQFTSIGISGALERRRDRLLMEAGLVTSQEDVTGISSPADGIVNLATAISPELIDVRRVAWLGDASSLFTTLWRMDEYEAKAFKTDWNQNDEDPPTGYSVAMTEPLQIQLIPSPSLAGALEVLVVKSGSTLNFATGVLLGIPDNLAWIVKYGAMADLLGQEGQASDPLRAKYCEQRWQQGVEIARSYSQVVRALVGTSEISIDSVQQGDAFNTGWQNLTAGTPDSVYSAGLSLLAVSPKPDAGPHTLALDVVRPAPIPANDAAKVQLGREELDVILDYAVHVASFKQGGQEFMETMRAWENMLSLATVHNEKLRAVTRNFESVYDRSLVEEQDRPRRDPGGRR